MLEIENFSKTYRGGKRAVDGLTLHVAPGDIFGFIGPNGAGKTTTLRAVAGVMDFTHGEIRVCGHSVQREPLACKQVTAYIPDNPDLYGHLTGAQYVRLVADLYRVPAKARNARVREIGERLEIADRLGELIEGYSHGMKQKLAIVSALLHAPKLLLLDEPFVGLDPKAAFTLKQMMRELCAQGGAIFFSTHVLEVAEKLCNKVAILKDGRLAACGDMDAVRGDQSLEEIFMELM